MGICSRCGNPVEFRYVGGRCIPLHIHGSCMGVGTSRGNDYSGYNVSHESTCFSTSCPECNNEVFFIRHNGGSVWIDPPLGPPWYKHDCFDKHPNSNKKSSVIAEYRLPIDHEDQPGLVIGVVKSTRVDILKRFTDIHFETGKQETQNIRLQHNAGFLLGKLCVYDIANAEIWPAEEPTYIFSIYKPPENHANSLVICPKCGAKLNPQNLYKHMRRQHGINQQIR